MEKSQLQDGSKGVRGFSNLCFKEFKHTKTFDILFFAVYFLHVGETEDSYNVGQL